MLAVLKPGAPGLERAVLDRLAACEKLGGARIEVHAVGNVVVLDGTVDCYARKLAAEEEVRHVPGVRGVVDRIEVATGMVDGWRDVDIQRAATSALRANYLLARRSIEVTVDNGVLCLSGRVANETERVEAERVVTPLPNVREVRDGLVVFDGPARRFV